MGGFVGVTEFVRWYGMVGDMVGGVDVVGGVDMEGIM